MKKTTLKNYARLLAEMGLSVKKGDDVLIGAALDQPEFVAMCVDACYKCGARWVGVEWDYQPLTKLHYRHCSFKTLSTVTDIERAKLQYKLDKNPAVLHLVSEDPDGLKGVNQKKMSKVGQARWPIFKPYHDALENKYKWCIAAVPGKAWANKVFPGVRTSTAMEDLWKAILYTSRVIDKDGNDLDPIAEWKAHNESFRKRCEYLNSLRIKTLEYKSANGTDLKVGMLPEGTFLGGSEHTLGGEEFNPNIPSEEIFTSPKAGCAEGLVVASLPLSYRGELIENFSMRFEGGRVVEVHADRGEEVLRQTISMDEGAAMLGECALVPYTSPIRESGITFYETLFDENAACHLALGVGFTNCIKDYDKYSLEELHAKGINDSMIHVDFMIGTDDLSIVAITESGERVQIFKNGVWAF